MTSAEFVMWFKGFTEAVHEYNVTPKQWDILKEKLAGVKDESKVEFPFGTPNTTPWTPPFNPHIDPYNPYKVTCRGEETPTGTTITTTPGTGYITVANPNIASFGTGSFSITTSTSTSLPSGSTVSYTNSNDKI
jgi:hypothetical protein